ncbi:MAG: urease accessory protein UreD [Burkholderiaceae bacterium]
MPHVSLRFARAADGRSFLARQFVRYPFHVCRPHADEARPGACTLTLQSLSGGLFEHDDLALGIDARDGARVRVTTAASTIVHAMRGGQASQSLSLSATGGACLAFLPEPQILFPGSRLAGRTRVSVDAASTVLCAEYFLAHDPCAAGAPGGPFSAFDSRFDVVAADAGGCLLARERCLIDGPAWLDRRIGLSNGQGVHASLWLISQGIGDERIAAWRAAIADASARGECTHAGVSRLPNDAGLQLRAVSDDVVALKRLVSCLAESTA